MSRIGRVSCLTFAAVVTAGCGAGTPQPRPPAAPKLPGALAQKWAGEADQIAVAASSGDGCRAQQLVRQLSDDVNAHKNEVPVRLRLPLLTGVSALVSQITCTPPAKPKHKPKPPGHDHGPGHGKGGD